MANEPEILKNDKINNHTLTEMLYDSVNPNALPMKRMKRRVHLSQQRRKILSIEKNK